MPETVLRAHTELSQVYKRLGRFEEALHHQEAAVRRCTRSCSTGGTDLRIKTLQIAHDTEQARQQAEILRLRTGELEAMVRGRTNELEEYQLEAFQRLAVLAEFRDTDTGEHTIRVGDLVGRDRRGARRGGDVGRSSCASPAGCTTSARWRCPTRSC